MEGELLDLVVGLQDAKTDMVMMQTPDRQVSLKLVKFKTPSDENSLHYPLANTLGIRHIGFVVDDIEAMVAKLTKKGTEIFSEIQNYENIYKLCYIRGPDGIISELAQQIKPSNLQKNNGFAKPLFDDYFWSQLGFKFRTNCVSEILGMVNDIRFRNVLPV